MVPMDPPRCRSLRARQQGETINRRIADGPTMRWKRTERSRPPKTGSSACALTTASRAIAMSVTDHRTVIWERPSHGQKPEGVPDCTRAAAHSAVVVSNAPVARIDRGSQRLGGRQEPAKAIGQHRRHRRVVQAAGQEWVAAGSARHARILSRFA